MKLFCIEYETCGYYDHIEDEHPPRLNGESIYDNLICPACCSMLLVYDDYTQPSFIESTSLHSARSTAPNGAVTAASEQQDEWI